MMFQASDTKGGHFLDLLNNNLQFIESTYSKGGSWLRFFGHSNSLYARATRAIVNHMPTVEYQLRFFSKEELKYLYGIYPIKTRQHILHECKRYNLLEKVLLSQITLAFTTMFVIFSLLFFFSFLFLFTY